jgi:hypothetical protein
LMSEYQSESPLMVSRNHIERMLSLLETFEHPEESTIMGLPMPSPMNSRRIPISQQKKLLRTKHSRRSFRTRLENEVLSSAIDPTHVDISRKSQRHGNGEEHADGTSEVRDIQLPFPIYGA